MIGGEYLILLLIASGLAIPVAFYFLNDWLSDFAYRIDMSWYMGMGVVITQLIAGITIAVQSPKSAMQNPVIALRDE